MPLFFGSCISHTTLKWTSCGRFITQFNGYFIRGDPGAPNVYITLNRTYTPPPKFYEDNTGYSLNVPFESITVRYCFDLGCIISFFMYLTSIKRF